MTPDLDIYEDESLDDRIVHELEEIAQHQQGMGFTSKQLAQNILGKGYTGHNIQKALLRLENKGLIIQRGRRWLLS